jgi:hypothetical protein
MEGLEEFKNATGIIIKPYGSSSYIVKLNNSGISVPFHKYELEKV